MVQDRSKTEIENILKFNRDIKIDSEIIKYIYNKTKTKPAKNINTIIKNYLFRTVLSCSVILTQPPVH